MPFQNISYDYAVSGLLEVENLTVDFATAQGNVRAVRDVSFSIAPGEVLGLVGESGSGKSVSSLAVLAAAAAAGEGERRALHFAARACSALPEERMRAIRGAGISMIFQEPMTALNPVMRIGDQVAEAVLAHPELAVAPQATSPITKSPRAKPGDWRSRRYVPSRFPSRSGARAIIRTSSREGSGSE